MLDFTLGFLALAVIVTYPAIWNNVRDMEDITLLSVLTPIIYTLIVVICMGYVFFNLAPPDWGRLLLAGAVLYVLAEAVIVVTDTYSDELLPLRSILGIGLTVCPTAFVIIELIDRWVA